MKMSFLFVVRERGAASGWEDEAFRFLLLEDMTKTTSVQAIVGNLNVVDGRKLDFLPGQYRRRTPQIMWEDFGCDNSH